MERIARRVGRVCEQCGGSIPEDRNNRAKTCSPECGVTYQNAVKARAKRARWEAVKPTCGGCGGEIPPERHAGSKYCSPVCKKRVMDARWREKSPGYMRGYLYGITPERYAEMLAEQGNACAICRSTEWPGKGNRPQVDHDHDTGAVRGLLCSNCNHGLGQFRDNLDLLRAAIAYLTT